MISNAWRNRIIFVVSAVVAVWLGSDIADMELFWPSLVGGVLVLIALSRFLPVPIGTVIVGAVTFGYIVGNRGFAQISLTDRIPLLPAEFALLVAGAVLIVQAAVQRTIPVRRDAINTAIIVWVLISSIRLFQDMEIYGAMALRDYATIYYTAFFFIAQKAGATLLERTYLKRCLYAGFTVLVFIFPFYMLFPDFFLDHFLVRGIPLIYFKGDLLGTLPAAGAMLAFARYDSTKSPWDLCLCLLMAGETMSSNNRASMIGLILPVALLALAGRRRFMAVLGITGVASVIVLFLVAEVRGQAWEDTPLHSMYERVVSLTDPYGEKSYSGEDTSFKGDNNAFRSTWWQIVIDETVRVNPWYGLGWGYDLAEPFTRVYYPEGGEDFSARSPHNVVVTVFARTGILGLIPFLALLAAFSMRFWRAVRGGGEDVGIWCASLTILTSACFGIVLEGPMGAVVFWTLLGLACSRAPDAPRPPAVPREKSDPRRARLEPVPMAIAQSSLP
jgi:O-antigen ligase